MVTVMIPMQSVPATATPAPPQPIVKVGKAATSSKGVVTSIIGCGKCCKRYRRKGCKANISAVRWFMHRSSAPFALFGSPVGQQIVVTTGIGKEWLTTALDGTSPSLPSVTDSRTTGDVADTYAEIQYEVRLFSSDLVGVRRLGVNMSYVPRWANRIWEIAGPASDRETDWVLQRICSAVNTATEDMWIREPLSFKQINEVPVTALPLGAVAEVAGVAIARLPSLIFPPFVLMSCQVASRFSGSQLR